VDPARLVRLVTRPRAITTRFTRLHAAVLRASRGRIRRSLVLGGGQPVLSLSTVGRRSGRRRSTVVAYLGDGGAFAVFGMNLGSEHDPAWSLNLEASPDAAVTVDGRRTAVTARRLSGSEGERLWRMYRQRLPAVERFRAIAGRDIPIWLLEPRRG
jgi:deazaflavin-dependent oxidoreductase (nitroreductase family)